MNNGKYTTESYVTAQAAKADRLWGAITDHKKICETCNTEFIWSGRKNTKKFVKARFCSRSCANNRSVWWKENAWNYRTLCFRNYEEKCALCGFDKVVAVHHIDESKANTSPQNLIPLCPNHHEMVHHSKWSKEVKKQIKAIVKEKF